MRPLKTTVASTNSFACPSQFKLAPNNTVPPQASKSTTPSSDAPQLFSTDCVTDLEEPLDTAASLPAEAVVAVDVSGLHTLFNLPHRLPGGSANHTFAPKSPPP